MMSEFPVIRYPLDQNDLKFPSLQWIGFAFKNILEYFIQGEAWLKERINFSRYAITPIGNLEEDAALSVIDTLYARNLSLNRHILWYSNTNVPDLGGHEDQDFISYF
jgi:DNA polymerase epsilon subunit 1